MSNDIHEIFAIKYGRHERKKAENYIGGDPHDGPEPIDYFVWAITGPSGNFVVDTGFDQAMAKKRGRVVTRQQLLDQVWGYSYYGDARTLDVHIRRLRQKLDACGDCIETVVGVGYRFIGCAVGEGNAAKADD